ncbi:amino acid ABC transporter substrate-binding protein [Aneurinibacillus migulanus]|uniref:Amino acid ABC transporter substrate-binding protein n=1 Tax=Aneurinibacillus migulanus TaxID=47500 RepID=A0A0D1XVJ3_ANEMI|nr:amino acid ABC transporter substrate-binding protein [Aneurinibacillus migulanus]KIV56143.1 amino acid ABC transporter substrate-binding protein [Aneurinibacillus migulanus]KON84205.1 amino acid ABC transporter substrate-binding protein [Aneurinibacillus migulanus]MCP1357233.1 amino acid ABC transporter substrate-binding protein [Aneurinibacillus migulanus]MED0895332.1 amino acid ABC transporter substrate-binding protein [Aneurinibacillus migulanus]MED1616109.1 amino acid ABC transporter su
MKRFAAIFLVFGMIISIIAGCSSASSSSTDKKLVIGVDDQFAPMGFRDEKNELVGFDIDYARAAGEKMGYEVVFQPIDWKAKESELSSGRIDLIWNGYTINETRKKQVLFTKPYLKNAQIVVTLTKSNISKLDDLAGKNVGLQALSSAQEALNGSTVKSKIKTVSEYKDNVLALSDLKIGRVDAVVIDEVVAKYYMSKEKDTFKILDESLAPEEYGVGVKKGNEKLLNELQKALDEINKDGTAAKISEKWFGEDKVLK